VSLERKQHNASLTSSQNCPLGGKAHIKMKNIYPNTIRDAYIPASPITLFIVTIVSMLLLTACDNETDYVGFADSYHNLLFHSDNYDTYLTSVKPQNSEFFYRCLDKHMARHHNEAQARINTCLDQCGADSVCNFNCNIESGTEFFEARRDLLELEKNTLQQNLDIEVLKLQGFYLGEIECLSINTVRTFQGEPSLSCIDIAIEYRDQYMSENHCKFKKKFYESDWEIL
jgi:hypothetical protein